MGNTAVSFSMRRGELFAVVSTIIASSWIPKYARISIQVYVHLAKVVHSRCMYTCRCSGASTRKHSEEFPRSPFGSLTPFVSVHYIRLYATLGAHFIYLHFAVVHTGIRIRVHLLCTRLDARAFLCIVVSASAKKVPLFFYRCEYVYLIPDSMPAW